VTRIEELELKIVELEDALADAIVLKPDLAQQIAREFKLSRQEAQLVSLLYRAKDKFLESREIARSIPSNWSKHSDWEDLDRPASYTGVLVYHVKRKLGPKFVENYRGFGYRLSPGARASVEKALAA
jgi:DNA-binding response OmpR family regulator